MLLVEIKPEILFGKARNAFHGADGLNGIVPHGGFVAEHDGVCTVQNGVGHVRDLRAGGTRGVHHGKQHLRGGNDRLAIQITQVDYPLLDNGNFLQGNFHSQVATGNHYTVHFLQNIQKISYRFMFFNFGKQKGALVHFPAQFAGNLHIFRCADKG